MSAAERQLITSEQSAGFILLMGAVIALICANLPYTAKTYQAIVHHSSGIVLFHHTIGARFWVNEVLMCLFFFHIGLELKYNLVNGALKNRRVAAMPLYGAIGGMLVPALCFFIFNRTTAELKGWAIPTATDIAFALGALSRWLQYGFQLLQDTPKTSDISQDIAKMAPRYLKTLPAACSRDPCVASPQKKHSPLGGR